MASRDERFGSLAPPALGGVVRGAASDFYFHSLRLVPINLVWGFGVAAAALLALVWPLAALILAMLLAVPGAAVFRVAAAIVRADSATTVPDAIAASVREAGSTLVVAIGLVGAAAILATNAVVGLTQTAWLGWVLGTLAAWGLAILWCSTIVIWTLLVDPRRADQAIATRLRTAALVIVAVPTRSAGLGILVGILAAISTVLVVALLSVGVAFIALVACRAVYPIADRLDPLAETER